MKRSRIELDSLGWEMSLHGNKESKPSITAAGSLESAGLHSLPNLLLK